MITIKTKPVPVNGKYGVYNGRMILQAKYRNTKAKIAEEIASQKPKIARGEDLSLNVVIYLGTKRKTDIDAYLKILMDAGEGVLYENDSQITELHVFKEYDKENPRIEINVVA